jgi:hypothetical protein
MGNSGGSGGFGCLEKISDGGRVVNEENSRFNVQGSRWGKSETAARRAGDKIELFMTHQLTCTF